MTGQSFQPPPLREASTILLVREENASLEVYLLQRSTQSGFMGGLYVFPGGVVDPEDKGMDTWSPCIDLSPENLDRHLGGNGLSQEDIIGFGIAAIRETLEEAGVFIASMENKTMKDVEAVAGFRLKQGLPKSWFKNRVTADNWILALSKLYRWSHWITPERMKKRFDTRFFVAVMPHGQACIPDNLETRNGIWVTPRTALEQNLAGRIPLSPPTVVTLTQMLKFSSLDRLRDELENRPWGDPIAPLLVPSKKGPVIVEPWDPEFHRGEEINPDTFSHKVLPAGSDFSRIWCDQGIWRPIKE